MIAWCCRAAVLLAAVSAASSAWAGPAAYRVVAYLDKYDQPSGLVEGSPGVFYSVAGSSIHAAFAVTSAGETTTLASFPSGYHIGSNLVGASNGRFYASVELSNKPATVFSVASTPGKEVYAAQNLAPALIESLPDGELLAIAVGLSGSPWYLAKAGLNGVVKTIAQFPSGERLTGAALYASDGNYYGISQGSTSSSGYVFRACLSGSLTKLHEFPARTFPTYLPAPLIESTDGNLYGAVPTGGPNGGGFVYALTLKGQYRLIYAFPKGEAGAPTSLIEASDGHLYGATHGNMPAGWTGELFRLGKDGSYARLYKLSEPERDGACQCDLVQASDGIFYGTAQGSGPKGMGAIFAWDAGLPKPRPWVRAFSPVSGAAGTRVRIWGANLLAAAVRFNGVPAKTVSNSGPDYVWAVVPAGAASGPVTVTTPGGTGAAPMSFAVR